VRIVELLIQPIPCAINISSTSAASAPTSLLFLRAVAHIFIHLLRESEQELLIQQILILLLHHLSLLISDTIDPEDPNAQLCTKYAKREYGLNDRDLQSLFHEKHTNPHYSGAAPMKLYYIRDLEVV
jgi:hypothetical protein